MVTIYRKELLQFFDEKVPESKGHATGIVQLAGEDLGIGLLLHYFRAKGYNAKVVSYKCNQRKLRGERLDRWVHVTKNKEDILYQVEVKNDSAHGTSKKPLSANATKQEVVNYKKKLWDHHWDGETLKDKSYRKVLIPMKNPTDVKDENIKPLLCLWRCMHKNGLDEPLFKESVSDSDPKYSYFKELWFFSMSSYLRTFKNGTLDIEMPQAAERISWVGKLFEI